MTQFSRIFLRSALIASFALSAVAPAFAKVDKVSTVDVTFDLPAVTNKAAALRFTHISDDLKNAISALIVDRLAEDGSKIGIDISEVELSNSFTEAVGAADTKLEGIVSITDATDNSNFSSYTLIVSIEQAKTFLPTTVDMTTLTASGDAYYTALIQAFAKAVVDRLDV